MHWLKGAALAGAAVVLSATVQAESLKPFVLASSSSSAMEPVVEQTREKLSSAGLEVVGEYAPYPGALVIGVTSDALQSAAAKSDFGGYAAVQRVAVTQVGEQVQVSYTDPVYMSHAYRMNADLSPVAAQLKQALGAEKTFGPEQGLSGDDLRDYHYMFGMPYFDDPLELASHKSYEAAVEAVEAGLAAGASGASKVWRVDIPGKKESVFGVGLKTPEGGDKNMDDYYIMSEIDFKPVRSTAHLPYEVLVSGDKVYALPAQFRIAVNFPDLKMMGDNSFMNIMGSPDAIKASLSQAAGAVKKSSYAWD